MLGIITKKKYNVEIALEKLGVKLELIFHTATVLIPNFLLALLIFIISIVVSRLISKKSSRAINKVSQNVSVNKLIGQILGSIILAMGIFFALGILHLDKTVTTILTGIGVLSLGFSFAFQHLAADFLSGMILIVKKSIKVGDLVNTNDVFGNIVSIDFRTTKILNVHGQIVEVPNRLITDNAVSDYSNTKFRRIDIKGRLNFNLDLTTIKKELEQEMSNFDFIYPEKQPNLVYNELDFEKVSFTLRIWVNFTNNDGHFVNARSTCIERMSTFFKGKGIELGAKEFQLNQSDK